MTTSFRYFLAIAMPLCMGVTATGTDIVLTAESFPELKTNTYTRSSYTDAASGIEITVNGRKDASGNILLTAPGQTPGGNWIAITSNPSGHTITDLGVKGNSASGIGTLGVCKGEVRFDITEDAVQELPGEEVASKNIQSTQGEYWFNNIGAPYVFVMNSSTTSSRQIKISRLTIAYEESTLPVVSVGFETDRITVNKGESVPMPSLKGKESLTYNDFTFSWAPEGICRIDGDRIIGLSAGEAVCTAYYTGNSYNVAPFSLSVEVKEALADKQEAPLVYLDGELFSGEIAVIAPGQTYNVTFSAVSPGNVYWNFEVTPVRRSEDFTLYDGTSLKISEAGTLYYYSQNGDSTSEIKSLTFGLPTSVTPSLRGEIPDSEDTIYTLSGMKVISGSSLKPGVYIIRRSGTVRKVIVRD